MVQPSILHRKERHTMQDSNNKVTVVVHIDDAPAFYSAYAEAVVEALKRLTQPNK